MPKYNTGPISHNDEPPAGQMNFTQDSIEALHRRVFFGHMKKPEAVAKAGGTQRDAAVTEHKRSLLVPKKFSKRREKSSATT